MTEGPDRAKNDHSRHNSEQLKKLLAELRKLAAEMSDPEFSGKITAELSAKNGRFGKPVTTRVRHH